MLESATGLKIPRVDEGSGFECCLNVPIQDLSQLSIQEWIVRLPVRAGGLGLRSLVDTSSVAFIGGLEMSLPFFGGENGVCTSLENVVGNIRESNLDSRWQTLVQSGCRTAVEFSQSWHRLQTDARDCTNFLGTALDGVIAVDLLAVGEGRTDGSTRSLLTEQRERLHREVLSRALEMHHDQRARPVWAIPQFDKLSQAWLLALPSPTTYLSSQVFTEAMASHLCLPSPACRGRVGQPVGPAGAIVDHFGDAVMCATLPFDTWRIRHDTVKLALAERSHDSKVEVECEVYGLFADIVPAAATANGGELEMVRQRQGLVPDFRFRLPTHNGIPDDFIAELKVISAGPSRYYQRGNRDKAVDVRARMLQREYKNKLAALDIKYHGVDRGEIGPLVNRLNSWGELQGLVVGQFGEGSQHLHQLLKRLAEAKVLNGARANGQIPSDSDVGVTLSHYRRVLSTVAVRAQASCLLARLGHLGGGARDAANRRNLAVRREAALREEARSFFQAHVRGRGFHRYGDIIH